MVKVIMHGCNGKMGQTIRSLIAADEEIEIVAGKGRGEKSVPGVFRNRTVYCGSGRGDRFFRGGCSGCPA